MSTKKPFLVRIETKNYEKIAQICDDEFISVNRLMNKLIDNFLYNRERKQKKRKCLMLDI